MISRFLPQSVKKYFNNKIIYAEVFIIEFTINSTTMPISAMSVLLHSGVVNLQEKINYLLQMSFLSTIISIPLVYYVLQRKKNLEKIKEREKVEKKINTNNNTIINKHEIK